MIKKTIAVLCIFYSGITFPYSYYTWLGEHKVSLSYVAKLLAVPTAIGVLSRIPYKTTQHYNSEGKLETREYVVGKNGTFLSLLSYFALAPDSVFFTLDQKHLYSTRLKIDCGNGDAIRVNETGFWMFAWCLGHIIGEVVGDVGTAAIKKVRTLKQQDNFSGCYSRKQ